MAPVADENASSAVPTDSSVVDRIPAEVLELIARINRRYTDLDLRSGEFLNRSAQDGLILMIAKINTDPDLARLNQLSHIGAIFIFWIDKARDRGKTFCFGTQGLYIYEWNEYEGTRSETRATSTALIDLWITALDLKNMIINYTDRDKFIKHAAEFRKF